MSTSTDGKGSGQKLSVWLTTASNRRALAAKKLNSFDSFRARAKQRRNRFEPKRRCLKKNFDVPLFSFQGGVGWTRIIHSRQGSFFVRQTKVSLKKATDVDRGAATAFVEFHLFFFFQHQRTMENENHALAFYSMATDTLITQ